MKITWFNISDNNINEEALGDIAFVLSHNEYFITEHCKEEVSDNVTSVLSHHTNYK